MKKITLFITALLLIAVTMAAENYPYRSDYLWVTTPDHADWLYKTGETATVEVQLFKYGYAKDVQVNYEIGQDMMPASSRGTVKLKNGKATISLGTRKAPGFTYMKLKADIYL